MAEPHGMRSFHTAGLHPAEVPAGAEDPIRPAPDVPGCGGGGQVHPWVPGTCRSLLLRPALHADAGSGCLSQVSAKPWPALRTAGGSTPEL